MEKNKNWKVVKSKSGSNTRIYTKNCDWCGTYYEGRGSQFCGKSCSAKWGRATKDYSNAVFGKGDKNPNYGGLSEDTKQNLSKLMKERWASGKFVGVHFGGPGGPETKLEKKVRMILDGLSIKYRQFKWLNKSGWKPKEYDFYIKELKLLIEVDGTYWHSLPENIENDEYKNKLAEVMGYGLIRIPENKLSTHFVQAAINDYRSKNGLEPIQFDEKIH